MTEMKDIKKRFVANSIKCIIGIILLFMSYSYIQSHPAEKISFFSGFKVIYQNVEIFFQNVFGNNGDLLKQKYALESYFQVLIALSEEKSCIDAKIVQDLHHTYEQLVEEPKNTLSYSLGKYVQKQYDFDKALKVDCEKAEPFNSSPNSP
ncbi:MAG: hypothetical protein LBP53_03590 [Candidatus Peribacteria bacterium]|jgi:hypothetical protein|nr:hypothetical protein [Candidatus Peribacteria bacterium]